MVWGFTFRNGCMQMVSVLSCNSLFLYISSKHLLCNLLPLQKFNYRRSNFPCSPCGLPSSAVHKTICRQSLFPIVRIVKGRRLCCQFHAIPIPRSPLPRSRTHSPHPHTHPATSPPTPSPHFKHMVASWQHGARPKNKTVKHVHSVLVVMGSENCQKKSIE